jgi:hypothetical protein
MQTSNMSRYCVTQQNRLLGWLVCVYVVYFLIEVLVLSTGGF